jgi:arylsulfatase A-like enzyme
LKNKPNIIILYADDLGFGDLGCYGAKDLPTPNIDSLAENGIKFNQAYATAATCTPSRYSLLTGEYPWRNPRASILRGDAAQLIEPNDYCLPKLLKKANYKTGIVGKWHLGLGNGSINWNDEIEGTPNDVGFDYSHILAATNDRTPCVYIHNRHVENLDHNDPLEVTYERDKAFPEIPTPKTHPELCEIKGHHGCIVNGIPRLGYMRGGKSATWDDKTMSDVFLSKALQFVKENQQDPFFLYYAFHQPHAPRIPSPRFAGASPMGPRGDVIIELDWCVGELIKELEVLGQKENTIIIFSSDNGPVLFDAYHDNSIELAGGHKPAGPLRGGKYSSYDGGTHVPFILSYPAMVDASESNAIVSQMDLYATFSELLNIPLSDNEAVDSFPLINAFFGKSQEGREDIALQGSMKNNIYRHKNTIYIPKKEGDTHHYSGIELGNSKQPQLYDISVDIGQQKDIAIENDELLKTCKNKLNHLLASKKTRI